jgi:hypothetical protein
MWDVAGKILALGVVLFTVTAAFYGYRNVRTEKTSKPIDPSLNLHMSTKDLGNRTVIQSRKLPARDIRNGFFLWLVSIIVCGGLGAGFLSGASTPDRS